MSGSPVKRARRTAAANGGDVVSAAEEVKNRKLVNGNYRQSPGGRRIAEMADQVAANPLVLSPLSQALGLNERQAAFVQFKAAGMSDTLAARHAGYPHAKVAGRQVAESENVKAAIAAERTQYQEVSHLSKKQVVDGFLEAIDQAKVLSDPLCQVAAWRELGRLMGYYENIHKHEIAVTHTGEIAIKRIQSLSDAELLKLIEEDTVIDVEFVEE